MNTTTINLQDRLLTQLAAVPASQTPIDGVDWFPPVDIVEDTEEYLFKIDLPEVNPDSLRLAVEENDLVICGERPNPWQAERKLLRVERPHGYFFRRFALPDDSNPREITTRFADSVLEVHVRREGFHPRPLAPTGAPPTLKLRSSS